MTGPEQRETFEAWCEETGAVPGVFVIAEHLTDTELAALRAAGSLWDKAEVMRNRIVSWNLTYGDAATGTIAPVPLPSAAGWEAVLVLNPAFGLAVLLWLRRIFLAAPCAVWAAPSGLQA